MKEDTNFNDIIYESHLTGEFWDKLNKKTAPKPIKKKPSIRPTRFKPSKENPAPIGRFVNNYSPKKPSDQNIEVLGNKLKEIKKDIEEATDPRFKAILQQDYYTTSQKIEDRIDEGIKRMEAKEKLRK